MWCLCAIPVRNNKIHHAYLLCLWHWSKDKHPGNPSVLVPQNNFLQDHSDICLCVYISYYHCRGGGHWVVWDNKMSSSATTLSRRPSDWRVLRLQTKSPVRTRTRMKSGACQHDHNFSMSPHASTINATCPFGRRIKHCQNQRFAKPFCKLGELPLCKHNMAVYDVFHDLCNSPPPQEHCHCPIGRGNWNSASGRMILVGNGAEKSANKNLKNSKGALKSKSLWTRKKMKKTRSTNPLTSVHSHQSPLCMKNQSL